jgi:polyvinyl alcohol dehydrogenase (cytochrome)
VRRPRPRLQRGAVGGDYRDSGAVFSPSNDGAIRAFSTSDGAIVWEFDTNREFQTVNGVKAHGGSMNGPAPVIVGGWST